MSSLLSFLTEFKGYSLTLLPWYEILSPLQPPFTYSSQPCVTSPLRVPCTRTSTVVILHTRPSGPLSGPYPDARNLSNYLRLTSVSTPARLGPSCVIVFFSFRLLSKPLCIIKSSTPLPFFFSHVPCVSSLLSPLYYLFFHLSVISPYLFPSFVASIVNNLRLIHESEHGPQNVYRE